MADILLNSIVMAYAGVGLFTLMAYYPTISDLYHKRPSANTNAYIMWSITIFITFLYSLFVVHDTCFIIISAINFVACTTILVLCSNLQKDLKTIN